MWVRANDNPNDLAEEISTTCMEQGVTIAAIGARAVNQAIKGIAIARERFFDASGGYGDLDSVPFFSTIVDEQGRERTRMMIEVRPIILQ